MSASVLNRDHVAKLLSLYQHLNQTVLGCDAAAELLLTALIAEGHVLLQGAPGFGKTSLAKTLAQSIDCTFKRIQFTPDLLPADVTGYSTYDQQTGIVAFRPGPVFANILLADEINRTTPRIQSALLEAMCESQVSVDAVTHKLEAPFMVVATQNHLNASGTFPLPDSQLDRFLLTIEIDRPDRRTQAEILALHLAGAPKLAAEQILTKNEVLQVQEEVKQVTVSQPILTYVAALTDATHKPGRFVAGISSRGALALMRTAQAAAYLDGRDAVFPEDVKRMTAPVFGHRLSPSGRSRKQLADTTSRLQEVIETISVP